MTDQQQTDEFTIYGILPEHSARGQIKYEDFRALVQDYLQLGPMYTIIMKILQTEYNVQIVEKVKIDIQTIYKSFDSVTFLREVPPVRTMTYILSSSTTESQYKTYESSKRPFTYFPWNYQVSMKDIRDATLVFQLKELELMTEGLPVDVGIINSLLWQKKINKAISMKVLQEWIKRCSDFFDVRNAIQTFEFLFLVANTVDRRNFFEKIPKATLDIGRDTKFRLFNVDSTGFDTLKNPDTKIQNYMNYQYNIEKATFEGRSLKDRNEYYAQKRQQKQEGFKKSNVFNENEFKKLLRDNELYAEIKGKLKNAQQLLNHSKLNGKMLRAQLKEELGVIEHYEELRTQPQPIIDKVRDQPHYKHLQNSRPQSAQYNKIKEEVKLHREYAKTQAKDSSIPSLRTPSQPYIDKSKQRPPSGRPMSSFQLKSTKSTKSTKDDGKSNRQMEFITQLMEEICENDTSDDYRSQPPQPIRDAKRFLSIRPQSAHYSKKL